MTMANVQVFDTLAYSKDLVARGFDKKQAEALAEVNKEFLVGDLATKEFVRSEIREAVLNLKIWIGGAAFAMVGSLTAIIKLLG